MIRLDRNAPLPEEMQGRWIDADDSSSLLIVDGGKVTCFGAPVLYDYKDEVDGALIVNLKINDETQEDSFQRANVTELVISPEGNFLASNVKFGCEFVRESS